MRPKSRKTPTNPSTASESEDQTDTGECETQTRASPLVTSNVRSLAHRIEWGWRLTWAEEEERAFAWDGTAGTRETMPSPPTRSLVSALFSFGCAWIPISLSCLRFSSLRRKNLAKKKKGSCSSRRAHFYKGPWELCVEMRAWQAACDLRSRWECVCIWFLTRSERFLVVFGCTQHDFELMYMAGGGYDRIKYYFILKI